jgi:peptide/nickel transport system permease protein
MSVAVPVGVYSAVHRGTPLDFFSRGMAAFGQAVPPFWLGLVLILIFGVIFRVLPTSGIGTPAHLVLPAFTLGWFAVAGLTRLTRSAMLDVLGAEFIKLARLKGMPERRVIWKHAFKNAALPVLTFAALLFVALLNGAIIVETVFNWPGVGLLVIEAVFNRDYPVVQTVVIILSAMYIGANLAVDVMYAYLNPKIRYS